MSGTGILRLVVVAAGIGLLLLDFLAYSYRKMTETIGLGWMCVSLLLLLFGVLPEKFFWHCLSGATWFLPLFLAGCLLLLVAFALSMSISKLIRKNQELAMHVSLLNQENEIILHELSKLMEQERVGNDWK